MKRTSWTTERLQHLFERYNAKYWKGKLPRYRVINSKKIFDLAREGLCDRRAHKLFINVASHYTDLQVRQTLLHEMAHAATKGGHGKHWLAEMERIKRLGAPIPSFEFQRLTPTQYAIRLVENAVALPWKDVIRERIRPYLDILDSKGNPKNNSCLKMLKRLESVHHKARQEAFDAIRKFEAKDRIREASKRS